MGKIRSFIAGLVIGAILSSGAIGWLALRPSVERVEQYRDAERRASDISRELGERLNRREETIGRIKDIATGTATSISKLREILLILKDNFESGGSDSDN